MSRARCQCYASVTTRDCDYALLPFENSLGGSIHENYDLMLRYDLHIIAEHEFRVRHCRIQTHEAKDEVRMGGKFQRAGLRTHLIPTTVYQSIPIH